MNKQKKIPGVPAAAAAAASFFLLTNRARVFLRLPPALLSGAALCGSGCACELGCTCRKSSASVYASRMAKCFAAPRISPILVLSRPGVWMKNCATAAGVSGSGITYARTGKGQGRGSGSGRCQGSEREKNHGERNGAPK